MNTLVHPVSGAEIQGLRLGPGAKIEPSDVFDATDGKWVEAGQSFSGLAITSGCPAIWVRPQTGLSEGARVLLSYLAVNRFYLADTPQWKVIPSFRYKNDGRMEWRIMHPECVKELISIGFVQPVPFEAGIYEVNEVGRAYTIS